MSIKSKTERATLVEAFRKAAAAALAADPGQENDGGTCNSDSPAIRIPGIREAALNDIAAEAGISVTPFRWFGGRRWFWVGVPMHGQANRRTRMMEAALKALKSAGLHAVCYYQMD